jgi:hypothetical protein
VLFDFNNCPWNIFFYESRIDKAASYPQLESFYLHPDHSYYQTIHLHQSIKELQRFVESESSGTSESIYTILGVKRKHTFTAGMKKEILFQKPDVVWLVYYILRQTDSII